MDSFGGSLSALNLNGDDDYLDDPAKEDSSETSSLNRQQLPGERGENCNALWERSTASSVHAYVIGSCFAVPMLLVKNIAYSLYIH